MKHVYEPGDVERTLVLLHGTGGSMADLKPLAASIDPDAGVLMLEGDVLEGDNRRFFKRLRAGVFDEADLNTRADAFVDRLTRLAVRYGLNWNGIVPLGYSNGANLVLAAFYRQGPFVSRALLLHPMPPYAYGPVQSLQGLRLFVTFGSDDPFVEAEAFERLVRECQESQAQVETYRHAHAHRLTKAEQQQARNFYWGG